MSTISDSLLEIQNSQINVSDQGINFVRQTIVVQQSLKLLKWKKNHSEWMNKYEHYDISLINNEFIWGLLDTLILNVGTYFVLYGNATL